MVEKNRARRQPRRKEREDADSFTISHFFFLGSTRGSRRRSAEARDPSKLQYHVANEGSRQTKFNKVDEKGDETESKPVNFLPIYLQKPVVIYSYKYTHDERMQNRHSKKKRKKNTARRRTARASRARSFILGGRGSFSRPLVTFSAQPSFQFKINLSQTRAVAGGDPILFSIFLMSLVHRAGRFFSPVL